MFMDMSPFGILRKSVLNKSVTTSARILTVFLCRIKDINFNSRLTWPKPKLNLVLFPLLNVKGSFTVVHLKKCFPETYQVILSLVYFLVLEEHAPLS